MKSSITTTLFTILFLTSTVDAATVTTHAGQTHTGEVRLEGQELVVTTGGGEKRRVALTEVKLATLIESPRGAATRPAPKGGEPGKPALRKPARKPPGGVKAEYFADKQMKDLCLAKRQENLNHAWPAGSSVDPAVPERFAARWVGSFTMPRYDIARVRTLFIDFDGPTRMWLNDKLVMDTWEKAPEGGTRGKFPLDAGVSHDFKIEYWHEPGEGRAALTMTTIDGEREKNLKGWYFTPVAGDNAAPLVEVTSPEEGAAMLSPAPLTIEINATDSDGQVKAVRLFDGQTLLATLQSPPYRVVIDKPAPGVHRFMAQAVDDKELSASSEPVTYLVAAPLPIAGERPWGVVTLETKAIGKPRMEPRDPAAAGGEKLKAAPLVPPAPARATVSGDTITFTHGGGELRGESDGFGCAFTELSGDFQLIARLLSIDCKDPEAQAMAGLVMQEDFRGESKRTSLVVSASKEEFLAIQIHRDKSKTPGSVQSGVKLPAWLRLIRAGKVVRTDSSADGQIWSPVSQAQTSLGDRVRVGLIAVTRDGQTPVTAAFDHLSVAPWQPSYDVETGGILLAGGSFLDESMVPLKGAVMDGQTMRVRLPGRNQPAIIARARVARLIFKPIPQDMSRAITTGAVGVMTASGDLLEASIESVTNGQAVTNSVLFGKRTFKSEELLAVLVGDAAKSDAAPPGAVFEVAATTGSRLFVKSIRAEKDEVILDEMDVGELTLPRTAVKQIRSVNGKTP